jgi:hypothetical protein
LTPSLPASAGTSSSPLPEEGGSGREGLGATTNDRRKTPVNQKRDSRKQVDEYFGRIEFEKRQKALQERQHQMESKEREHAKEQHWMHCPKCGIEMVEIVFEDIRVDKCSACLGIFFDDGEIEQRIKKNKPGVLRRIAAVFED